MSIPVTNVPIAEYPYYYRCKYCTGAAFFLKEKPDTEMEMKAVKAIHTDGSAVYAGERVKCDVCGMNFNNPSSDSVIERPDPLGVKND